ncbi:hypothetical protein E3N88_44146 [Mikania micrantha]|uniref:Uncharacterized protein n=1 Tax=Mikania micrantha TaxID=192012 RepID=A0A5N6LD23_9ASTR|nr:hypothetical protein E3N88_44146 [Mikania micrantha]
MAQADRRRAAWETRVERRLEDLVQWTVASEHARRDRSQLPPFPEPRVYQTTDRLLDHSEVVIVEVKEMVKGDGKEILISNSSSGQGK